MVRKITKTLILSAVLAIAVSANVFAFSFSDIQFWVGSGNNQAGLIIDWNDGKNPESLAWGFRWDGTATGEDMLKAIAKADPRLYIHISTPGGYGVALFGVGYDLNNNLTFATIPSLAFVNGISVGNPNDNRVSAESGDHYKEGWWSAGFWSYWLKSSSSSSWSFSGVGMSSRVLSNGVWDGWSWAPNFNSKAPDTPIAAQPIPEPSTILAVTLGMAAFATKVCRKTL